MFSNSRCKYTNLVILLFYLVYMASAYFTLIYCIDLIYSYCNTPSRPLDLNLDLVLALVLDLNLDLNLDLE